MSNDATYGSSSAQERPRGSGLAITALVLGILALLLFFTVVGGILFGIIAIVLGLIASGRAKRGVAGGRGMAITGVVLGVLGVLLAGAVIAIGATLFHKLGFGDYASCVKDAGNDSAKVQKCEDDFKRNVEDKTGTGSSN